MKKNIAKRLMLFAMLIVATTLFCSCYHKKEVDTSEVGIKMDDGVSISSVVGPGRYTNMGWYSDLVAMDTSTKELSMTIEDVSTSDKQTVSVTLYTEVARKSDETSVRNLWKNYNAAARYDEQLLKMVSDLHYSAVNKVSTQYTIDEMLGIADSSKTRTTLESDIAKNLAAALEPRGISLVITQVKNVGVDPDYQAKLQEKSTAAIEIELAAQKAEQLEKQLEQEVAQTNIDLEKARRANLVAEEQAKVYEESEEAYELKRLELLKDMLGESDKVYFIPEGTDITLFLGNQVDTPVPVQ